MSNEARGQQQRVCDFENALMLLAPFQSLLLAVSGGPDSVALMLACARWSARNAHDIAVATVDHGLREGSRAEAEQVENWAQQLGFSHRTLIWEGKKPATRVQERARDKRYALLADCALRIGAKAIVTAHHADDQAETVLFRLSRGSGVTGLSGMAAASRFGDVALLRPLLGFTKQELESFCTHEKQPFLRDPSNDSARFARVKLRALAPLLAEQGLDRDALLRLGARAAQAEAALASIALDAFAAARRESNDGVTLDAESLRRAPQEILQRVIALGINSLAPQSPLRLERLERAAARVGEALSAGSTLRLTLAETMLDLRRNELRLRTAPPRRSTALSTNPLEK